MPPDVGRRRPHNQYQHHQPHPHPPHPQQYPPPPMYSNNYMQAYGNAAYYPQPMPPQYHNAPMPHQYAPYPQPPFVRSPPPMQHFVPAPLPQPQQQPPYPRPQQSPAVVPTHQAPPPQAPSSTTSSHTVPAPMTPPTPQTALSVAPSSPEQEFSSKTSFRAPLPWLSRPDLSWPARKARKKRKAVPRTAGSNTPTAAPEGARAEAGDVPDEFQEGNLQDEPVADLPAETEPTEETHVRSQTPSTGHPEEELSTNPTTPSSQQLGEITPAPSKPAQKSGGLVIPALPKIVKTTPEKKPDVQDEQSPVVDSALEVKTPVVVGTDTQEVKEASRAPAPKAWATPKSWTGLFNPAAASSQPISESGLATTAPGVVRTNAESLAEALRSFNAVTNNSKVTFLKPRGLVNTGNMCYMNSVLQVLIFCTPFFSFLDQVSKRAAHNFKSETPLIDAMILFLQEFPVIDSAKSVEQLKMRLKEGDLEQYGDPFTPDFVYNVINRLPRFSSMRRGHQQDAEEFLGFLLEGLHDECVLAMRNGSSNTNSAIATPNGPSSPVSETGSTQGSVSAKENGWLEVGPKQKAAVTRSSGTISTGSPVTKIFGGNLRSELRVPGLKDSVTLEPYQPLQLDIGAPNVNNIVDALKGLTRSEVLHGDFKSPKGPNVTATKQVFIETLPPVLILHLKRFQYDNAGGTQKIWKKVGYPLELEIPKEVFSRQKRAAYAHSGLPKYRLIAAVYHHGKNATGGHYTVDVRRQDGREWVRLDDTVIRRVRSEEVAAGGSEEDPKVLAAALDGHKKDGNGFAAIDGAEDEANQDGWKQASGTGKKWSAVANGASAPKAKSEKFSVKDNKVAYLLFYQKI
ncbi:putative ubiquitin carboxyl-terminal hydrolase 10 [Drepanopeziza brunnea f. sp. 'multigermtubi' MB_m1]|uniref:ubiquitinyl hydrolase 1 n=1 Tax=Marssonina brunnea f. sp. multigermtubi (strain MB_m1) TaxID=1072389 RepID=K1WTD7_MARBU|nr:putative ubiquitin carboxyl-terminal hydrolase 10 [Drepanopeziza brunnea f. sp. 'multigermtubi' MB_m1]EKD20930.1 putative ubiquitin carboxyl-terminal hydrolase 10 [Drepanopeziza brunnea f. sp. 'multigermtubi' MB_m1]